MSNTRINHPSDVVKEGETINVKILGIDAKEKRLKLSMKEDATAGPAEEYVNVKDFQTDEQATTSLKSVFEKLKIDIDKK